MGYGAVLLWGRRVSCLADCSPRFRMGHVDKRLLQRLHYNHKHSAPPAQPRQLRAPCSAPCPCSVPHAQCPAAQCPMFSVPYSVSHAQCPMLSAGHSQCPCQCVSLACSCCGCVCGCCEAIRCECMRTRSPPIHLLIQCCQYTHSQPRQSLVYPLGITVKVPLPPTTTHYHSTALHHPLPHSVVYR